MKKLSQTIFILTTLALGGGGVGVAQAGSALSCQNAGAHLALSILWAAGGGADLVTVTSPQGTKKYQGIFSNSMATRFGSIMSGQLIDPESGKPAADLKISNYLITQPPSDWATLTVQSSTGPKSISLSCAQVASPQFQMNDEGDDNGGCHHPSRACLN